MNHKIIQMFCFSHAGGTASFYDTFVDLLGSEIDVHPFEYSGHGKRYKEACYNNFSELANEAYDYILEKQSDLSEYVLFGYSMGCIAVIEVLQKILNSQQIKKPFYVFLAAHAPCTIRNTLKGNSANCDEFIIDRTIQFGGIPDALIDNRIFWRTYLPLYKSDYSLIDSYEFSQLLLKTNIPLSVFYSEEDTPYEEVSEWNKFFLGKNNYYKFNGNHFFINENYSEIVRIIKSNILAKDEDV